MDVSQNCAFDDLENFSNELSHKIRFLSNQCLHVKDRTKLYVSEESHNSTLISTKYVLKTIMYVLQLVRTYREEIEDLQKLCVNLKQKTKEYDHSFLLRKLKYNAMDIKDMLIELTTAEFELREYSIRIQLRQLAL
ncbi:hypothetical protein CDAR_433631 [Caerostris darwini]|uniref:Uncharacterized protein n=1 Tax=Caerostris darwini TaxID=1538125 RepID=A0AAV4PGA5_9ARAC|nr:hypothetical protein CDAR_433631 [Caerostris darwini]